MEVGRLWPGATTAKDRRKNWRNNSRRQAPESTSPAADSAPIVSIAVTCDTPLRARCGVRYSASYFEYPQPQPFAYLTRAGLGDKSVFSGPMTAEV